jgi:anti-sigma factor RsiW
MLKSDSMLVAYVDGELDPATARKVEALLVTDAQAAERVRMFRETAALLRAACDEQLYGDEEYASLPARRPRWVQRGLGWAIAASLAVVAAGLAGALWGGRAPSPRDELMAEAADYHHFHSRDTRHLVEVPADRGEEIAAWMRQHLQRDIEAPDLTAAGLRFAGSRIFVVNSHPVAELMYTRDRGLPIGVCVTRMDGAAAPVAVEQRGQEVVTSWIADGYAYVVVGELDASAARDIARRVAAQMGS